MIRLQFLIATISQQFFPMLVDATIKGALLLLLAWAVCLLLRRDSAATRHLVWTMAVVLLLVMPILSLLLPQWRVLPNWSHARPDVASSSPASPGPVADAPRAAETSGSRHNLGNDAGDPSQVVTPGFSLPREVEPRPMMSRETDLNPGQGLLAVWAGQLAALLTLVWLVGCILLLLRLLVAVVLLRKSATRCRVLALPNHAEAFGPNDLDAGERALLTAMDAVAVRLGITRSVQLLLDPRPSMPVVWGLWRLRLRLPAEAIDWHVEQQRSVLLHELAHVRRHDLMVLVMTQFACALNWLNPLMWFAAWQMHLERERACDDLVLSAGVRPSSYAEHLVELVSRLRPPRLTRSCGLAMARKSSLEGRLLAVLNEQLNRRGVTRVITAAVLVLGAAVAIPVAMLRAADTSWNPPRAAHVGTNEFSTFCDHDGKTAAFIIAYRGDFGSSSTYDSNPQTRTWTSTGTLTAKKPSIAFSFHRVHTAPDKLTITVAPADARDLSKPASAPREAGQKEYDLTKGRVFLVHDDGVVRQLAIEAPIITEYEHAKELAARIAAALPPQTREPTAQQQSAQQPGDGAKLEPGLEERLQWGQPVNGLRAAVVIRHSPAKPNAGAMPELYVVVQNVSAAPIRFNDTLAEQEPRMLYIKIDGTTQAGIGAKEPRLGNVILESREVAFVPMYSLDPLPGGRTTGSIIAEDALKDTRQTFVAVVQIETAPAGAWTGKLFTGEMSGAVAAGQPQPKGKEAKSLFKVWLAGARMDGKIPGGALGSLARAAANFVKLNPTDERAPKLAEFLKRIDMSHDWTPAEAVALLDEVTAIYPSLPEWAMDEPRFTLGGSVQTGQPLPAELENAPWGQTEPNRLRTAWLLDPRAEQHRLGTPLKSRILFHNAGESLVVFPALTWNQSGSHKARDAKGAEINIVSIYWTTIPRVVACRLAPGEFLEVIGAGIGVGANKDNEDWYGTRVGSWIETQPGDEVTFTPAPVFLTGRFTDERADGEPGWWLKFIKDRLSHDLPLPAEAAERGHLLDLAVRDLFGTAPTPDETATFVADRGPDAFESLAKRLAERAGTSSFTGTLQSGPTQFRVLPADPDAATRPRTACNPGRYTLGENARLVVTRRGVDERIVNEASIQFFSPDPSKPAPGEPHELKLPDGYDTWAAAWVRGGTVLWLQEKSGGVRRYDFAEPANVKEDAVEPDLVPADIRKALNEALTVPAPKPARSGGASGPPASAKS